MKLNSTAGLPLHTISVFDLDAWEISHCIEQTSRTLFNVCWSAIEETFERRVEEGRKKSLGFYEHFTEGQYAELLEDERLEQRQAVTTMTLALISEQLNRHLTSYVGQVNQDNLPKIMSRFKEQFGIDLSKLQHYGTIEEINLARNDCVHKKCLPSDGYKERTARRLIHNDGYLLLNPDLLAVFLDEIKALFSELAGSLKRHRLLKTSDGGD